MTAPLEARCRRLLLTYPRAHRAVHGEEMLGVLLACAGPDRTRLPLRDAADIVRGGLLVRLRRVGGAGWTDAAAVTGLVALLLISALAPIGLIFGPLRPSALEAGHSPAVLVLGALPFLAWPVVLVLAYAGHRALTGILGVAALVLGHELVLERFSFPGFYVEGAWRLLGTVALIGALTPPGPRGAIRLLGRRRTAMLLAGTAILGALHLGTSLAGWSRMPAIDLPVLQAGQWLALGLGAGVFLLLAAVLRRGPVGRCSAVLLACPLAFYLVEILRQAPLSSDLRDRVEEGGVLLGLLVAAATVVVSLPLSRQRTID